MSWIEGSLTVPISGWMLTLVGAQSNIAVFYSGVAGRSIFQSLHSSEICAPGDSLFSPGMDHEDATCGRLLKNAPSLVRRSSLFAVQNVPLPARR